MNETKGNLLQGESDNFYDYIKQAILRTDLHCRNKSKCDYGAKSYWQRAATSDPLYKAVALYNQAYITLNLAKDDYIVEARELLEQAKKSVDVYISETSNTMVSCQMSVNDNLKPHSNNFQSQMEARMNIFKSWKTYIDNALKKLVELEKDNSDAITQDCSVYKLLEEKDFIITNELMALYELGLAVVFEVKKKPKFCFDALICFFIGAMQVLAGVLVCAFSFGTASQFGLGLIGEGVSDMINGIVGMRQKHNMRSASRNTKKSLTEKEQVDLMDYMEHISNVATAFDIIVLIKSGLLNGRGIHLTVIDEHGNRLSEEHYKGTDESAGNITLQLTKQAKDLQPPEKSSSQQFYSGRFDIVQDDGTVVNVNSEHQNCLYHAIAQATGSDPSDLKGAAVKLREKVKNEVQENFASYTPILKLQRGYDYSHKNPGKYTITGGAKPGGASHSELLTEEEYLKSTSFIETDECDIIRSYKLASVEKYKQLIDVRQSKNNSGTVNADHVPSKDSIRKAWERTKDKPELQEQLKNSNPKLYEMIESIKDDNDGRNLIAMEVLAKDHKRALTMGASHQAMKCRELLAESLVSGDVETMLKQSMIVAHPLTSQELMADL
eukprot:superscaffoldBa00011948_g25447